MLEGNSYTGSDQAKHQSETTFQLKRQGLPHQSISVSVDFSPSIKPIDINHQQNSILQKSIPVFNMDGNFFTPAFILQFDQEKYTENRLIYKEMFVKKVGEADQELSQMYLPHPSKANSFCCVCKTFFDDYLTHVNLPLHITFMQKSQFHDEINSLCGKFTSFKQEKMEKQVKKRATKTKTVKKEPKQKRNKKVLIEPLSTRVQSNGLLCDELK